MSTQLQSAAESAAAQLGIIQHQLRARDTGQQIVADLHLLFPQAMPIGEAHRLATEFENLLAQTLDFPIEIISHLESLEDHE